MKTITPNAVWRVSVGYLADFDFSDVSIASRFAETAQMHYAGDKNPRITIELLKAGGEEQEAPQEEERHSFFSYEED